MTCSTGVRQTVWTTYQTGVRGVGRPTGHPAFYEEVERRRYALEPGILDRERDPCLDLRQSRTTFSSRAQKAFCGVLNLSSAPRPITSRGGYRDPESQTFIENWFSKLKQRYVWREEFETLDEACEKIGAYIDLNHGWPRLRLACRTPREVVAERGLGIGR